VIRPDVVFVDEEDTHRLIASAYAEEPAIAPLYDDEAEKAILDRLEARTSNRLLGQEGELDEVDAGELVTESFGYGWSFVNAAFSYTRAGGSRFNREGRGAWYAARSVETCLAEVGFHLTRELRNTGETENRTRYVQLIAHMLGPMASLMKSHGTPCLDPDVAVGYPAGQAFAAAIRARNLAGIVYPSVRHAGGTCLVALVPAAIRRVTRGQTFLLTWSGGSGPEVERQ
jgi:RES domain-containing protein